MADIKAKKNLLLYGANGFTGKLTIERAKQLGLQDNLVLAGRSKEKIEPLAAQHGLPYRVFDLDSADEHLADVAVVLHMAGPFMYTAKAMIAACMRTKTHYLDITGEIDVFEHLFSIQDQMKKAGIVCVTGAGFDVVPTDCMAKMLSEKLPSATHLELAFDGGSAPQASAGTAKTAIFSSAGGFRTRQNGELVLVPFGYKAMEIQFRDDKPPVKCNTIPWGDVSTAYHSTKIPNVDCYLRSLSPPALVQFATSAVNLLLYIPGTHAILDKLVDFFVAGPDAEKTKESRTYIWGRAMDKASNQTVTGKFSVPQPYLFTADTALAIAVRLADPSSTLAPGTYTPSLAFGGDFVTKLEGVSPPEFTVTSGESSSSSSKL